MKKTYDEREFVMSKLEVINEEISLLEQLLGFPARKQLSEDEREHLQQEMERMKKEQAALEKYRFWVLPLVEEEEETEEEKTKKGPETGRVIVLDRYRKR